MPIYFESESREASILSPLNNFALVAQTLEHRRDPLTGRSSIVVKGRLDYVKSFLETDQKFLDELVLSTKNTCPFCPEAVASRSPKFIPELAPEGRIRVRDAICFPSLFAHEDFNAVVVPTPEHGLSLLDLSPRILEDGFAACLLYFERVKKYAKQVSQMMIAMNFLPPAGSTIAHPHIQALASDLPLQGVAELQQSSSSYFKDRGSSYWLDLIETEKQIAQRYVGETKNVSWITPFAPLGFCEVQGIVRDKFTVATLSVNDLANLANGLGKVLRFYFETGIRSFNFAFCSGGDEKAGFNVLVRIVARYGYKPRFVSDIWALQYLFGEREVSESPEETCSRLKGYFS
jgi:galactose-1-phosphate uridylyltransferase